MNKWLNIKAAYILPGVFAGAVILFVLFRSCSSGHPIQAEMTPTDPIAGETVTYRDSTSGAEKWLWEFGNGDQSREQKGSYVFRKSGKYQVRLTVDGNREKLFLLNVRQPVQETDSRLVEITAPDWAIQGEYISFRGIGNDKQWRWEFGESGIIDSREKNPIHAYSTPGTYEVLLSTENTRYPVRHRIEIVARYMENDTTDAMTRIGNDIREKLQAIADGQSFNNNYNFIRDQYLCGNDKTQVTINNNKYNDIYSYCQGLHLTGRKETLIEQVIVEISQPENGCVDKIVVIQSDKNL